MKIMHYKYVMFTVCQVFFMSKREKEGYLKVPEIEKPAPEGDSKPCSQER